jgi:hypothetical protein
MNYNIYKNIINSNREIILSTANYAFFQPEILNSFLIYYQNPIYDMTNTIEDLFLYMKTFQNNNFQNKELEFILYIVFIIIMITINKQKYNINNNLSTHIIGLYAENLIEDNNNKILAIINSSKIIIEISNIILNNITSNISNLNILSYVGPNLTRIQI